MNMKTSPNDVSNNEVLKEFKKLAASVTGQINEINVRLGGIDSRFDKMDARMESLEVSNQEILEVTNTFATSVENRLGRLEHDQARMAVDQTRMSATMVTKGYLDDKLADLKSDLVQYTRREIERATR